MSRRTVIVTTASVPNEHMEAWLQHLRNFDTAHAGCHFSVQALSDMSTDEIAATVRNIDPPFRELEVLTLREFVTRKKETKQ